MTEVTTASAPRRARANVKLARWFYPGAGVLLLALTVMGFRLFFFKGLSHPGREIPPPIRTLIIVHGVAMSAWIVLFAVQTWLIASRNHRMHMTLGRVAAAFAAVIVLTGLLVGVRSAQVTPGDAVIFGLTPKQFMAVPVVTILSFGAFVGVGVWKRKRPAIHRPCMFLGTLAAVGAAVSRIDPITGFFAGTVLERAFGPFIGTIVIGAVLVALRCVLARSIDRVLISGMVVLTGGWALTMAIAPTGVWDAFASIFVK